MRLLMSRLSLLCSVVFLMFWWAACPGPPPGEQCTTRADCAPGLPCLEGRCGPLDAGKPAETVHSEKEPVSEPAIDKQPEKVVKEVVPEPIQELPVDTKCTPGETRLCYSGPPETRGKGACYHGKQSCKLDNTWSPCRGETLPKAETCDGKDNDCDGSIDNAATCDLSCEECKQGKCVVKADATPVIKSLNPSQILPVMTSTVTVTGSCFSSSSSILFESTPLKTTFNSATELEFTIDTTGINPGKYKVFARNSGGALSVPVEIEVLKPVCTTTPFLSSLSHSSGESGQKIPLVATGFSFVTGATLVFDGKPIMTKFVGNTSLAADPSLDLVAMQPGTYDVWVRNPDSCESRKLKFYVLSTNPTPEITTITPSNVPFDKSSRLSIIGKNFVNGATFFVGLKSVPQVVYQNPGLLTVTLTPSAKDGWNSGTFGVFVANPNSNRSKLYQLTFTNNPPTLSKLSPSIWSNGCKADIDVQGNNFEPQVSLTFDKTLYDASSATHKLTRTNETALKFQLDPTQLAVGSYDVKTTNGPSGDSAILKLKIVDGTKLTPLIDAVTPSSGKAGQTVSVKITAKTGGAFYPGASVELDGKAQVASCTQTAPDQPCTELAVQLDLSATAAGSATLVVSNPCNKKSANHTFTVTP